MARIRLADAASASRPPVGWRRLEIALPVVGREHRLAVDVEDRRARLSDVVPLARLLCDEMVSAGAARSEAAGRTVSCRKGCGACCSRYLVCATAPEGFRIVEELAALPESAQAAALRAFQEADRRLEESGLHDELARRAAGGDLTYGEQFEVLDGLWARERFPCPLLVDQACSRYAVRPLVCREFLATSDPALCGTPDARRVDLPVTVSHALALWASRMEGAPPSQVVFMNLIPWYQKNAARAQRTWRATDLVEGFLRAILDVQENRSP